jgi:transposase InsO family protein
MAYSINPNLPKARATALRLLLAEGLPAQVVANKCGVHRSTIWRWKRKWDKMNQYMQRENLNRPAQPKTTKPHGYRWNIPTLSSKPHNCSHAISDELVRLVLTVRDKLKRCAEVVWHHLVTILGVAVSLSSVKRILRRHHYFDGARKPRIRRDNPRRPHVSAPGELVQTDTIHHVDPYSGRRMYIYTVIDLYSRMTHAVVATKCLPGLAAKVVLSAQAAWGFPLAMVQADNGPEYSRYFEEQLHRAGIQTRHSRLHRPNDNAHIERFNRTIQTECIGYYWRRSVPLLRQQERINEYIDYYNTERVHLGIQLRTPVQMLQRS